MVQDNILSSSRKTCQNVKGEQKKNKTYPVLLLSGQQNRINQTETHMETNIMKL